MKHINGIGNETSAFFSPSNQQNATQLVSPISTDVNSLIGQSIQPNQLSTQFGINAGPQTQINAGLETGLETGLNTSIAEAPLIKPNGNGISGIDAVYSDAAKSAGMDISTMSNKELLEFKSQVDSQGMSGFQAGQLGLAGAGAALNVASYFDQRDAFKSQERALNENIAASQESRQQRRNFKKSASSAFANARPRNS